MIWGGPSFQARALIIQALSCFALRPSMPALRPCWAISFSHLQFPAGSQRTHFLSPLPPLPSVNPEFRPVIATMAGPAMAGPAMASQDPPTSPGSPGSPARPAATACGDAHRFEPVIHQDPRLSFRVRRMTNLLIAPYRFCSNAARSMRLSITLLTPTIKPTG